jgi:hypothetical protein
MKQQCEGIFLTKSIVAGLMFVSMFVSVRAQDGGAVGTKVKPEVSASITAGYGFHDGTFRSLPPVENCCTGYESSGGFSTGGHVSLAIPVANGALLLGTKFGYQYFNAAFSATTVEKVYGGSVASVDARIRHDLDVSWNMAVIGVGAEYAIMKQLWLGLWLDGFYVIRAGYEQRETIESPANIVFENGATTRDVHSGKLADYNSITGGVAGQIRYRLFDREDIGTFTGIDLVCRYMVPFTSLYQHDTQWRESSIDYKLRYIVGGVSVTF